MEGRLSLRGIVANKMSAKESVGRGGGIYGTEDGVFRALSPAELPRTCRYMQVPRPPALGLSRPGTTSTTPHAVITCALCHYTLGPG